MSEPIDNSQMPLIVHLRELRKRLVAAVIAVAVAFVVTYTFSEELYALLAKPVLAALPEDNEFLAFTGVIEPFYTYLKVALTAAIVLASPVIFYEIWAFAAPGLLSNEKRWFFPIVLVSVCFFLIGVSFAYFVVFPIAFKFLLSYAAAELRPILSMGLYFSFATKMLIAFGAVFEMPIFVLVLSRLGLVTSTKLIGWWKYALLFSVIVGALLTPPDVFSQSLMAGPIMVLYVISIAVAYFFGKKKKKDSNEDEE
ncbi:MAG: twin-arginine translocase subunit TatC [Thermodesulfobacteriota bacterium]